MGSQVTTTHLFPAYLDLPGGRVIKVGIINGTHRRGPFDIFIVKGSLKDGIELKVQLLF